MFVHVYGVETRQNRYTVVVQEAPSDGGYQARYWNHGQSIRRFAVEGAVFAYTPTDALNAATDEISKRDGPIRNLTKVIAQGEKTGC